MKYSFYIMILFLSFSCTKQDPQEQLTHINGYWEIEKVAFAKDSVKEFTINENVDYFEIEDGKGFRKKVRPQFDGSYLVTEDAEKVEAVIENNTLYLKYSTAYDSWKEKVITASEDKMSIENRNNFVYYYKRFTPLLENYEKEN